MNKILYITDLDGTLLNSKSYVSDKSIEIINQLIEKGISFTYATARSLSSASIVTKGLNIKTPVIVYNGAFIINPKTNDIISSCYFNKNEMDDIQMLLHTYSVYPLVYTHDNGIEKVIYLDKELHPGTIKYLENRKHDKRMTPVTRELELYKGNIFYYTCIGEYQDLKELAKILKSDNRYNCTFQQELYSKEYWLEIMPKEATKANAILKLKEILNCNKVVCFGDAVNDIPMFHCSDEAYATKNAVVDLKRIATSLIGSNDNDAVAMWLKNNIDMK